MRILLLITVTIIATGAFATSITVFPADNGGCRYVLMNDNNKPVATWTANCLENVSEIKTFDIKNRTPLWDELKRLDTTLNLQNIKLNFTENRSIMRKLKALPIPVINPGDKDMLIFFENYNASAERTERQEVQDYNSSRSNKANSVASAPDYNSSRSNKANSAAPAQDYNSSRSNKANSVATAQDYNSSRSNKANSIAPSQDYNSSRSNKANSVATAQDYNSSRSNKANSVAPAQDYNSSRSNKAGIFISAGILLAKNKNYMENGFSFNAGYHIPIKYRWGVEVGIGFWLNSFVYKPSSLFPKNYSIAIKSSIKDNKWSHIPISAGPSISVGKEKLNAIIYIKGVLLYTQIPEQTIGGEYSVAAFSGDKVSFLLNPGLRLNYSIANKINLFICPDFFTSLENNIPHVEKNISRVVDSNGKFNQDIYSSLPFDKKYSGIFLFGVNAGFKVDL